MGQPVVHFEVIGKDAEKLHRYYSELFGWTFLMKDVADAKFPFGKDRWIQRNLIPISEGVACLDAGGALLDGTAKSFHRVLDSKAESMWETELDLLCKLMVRPVEPQRVSLINRAGVNAPGRQHISRRCRRESAPGKGGWGAIRAARFFRGHNDVLGDGRLTMEPVINCQISQKRECQQRWKDTRHRS